MPPVNADFCFLAISIQVKKRIFGALALQFNFWDEFDYRELTINSRQKDDLRFSQLLQRIRVGTPSVDDIKALKTKCIPLNLPNKVINAAEWFAYKIKETHDLVALFPTSDSVNIFNEHLNKVLKIECKNIKCRDENPAVKLNFKPNKISTESLT